jgi:hypothetical protein
MRPLSGYRDENLWKNRDANPLAVPFALMEQLLKALLADTA